MIKAVVFDMFETLVTLFEGRTYFSEDIAEDIGVDLKEFQKEWHKIEEDRSKGKYTIKEGLEFVLKNLGVYSEEKVELAAGKRLEALGDTFSAIPEESLQLLKDLKAKGIKIGLITNTFSDERDKIRECPLFPYFDVALISFEQGICKPAPEMYSKMIDLLGVKPNECMYVGDGGSRELFAARDAGMHPVQCTWFYEKAFEPHIPCYLLKEFPHATHQSEILDFTDYSYITLRESPAIKDEAAEWFHSCWGVPKEAYLECMNDYLNKDTEYGWYLCTYKEKIVGGLGVIENDFHDRKDLFPNICAVYTNEAFRNRGIAGELLTMAVRDLKEKGISPVYLVTDHTGFYERYGWEFFCMAQGDDEPEMTGLYIHR
ncbi:MAG: GNAT family N-acetyltransferase [Lachnospiraceae bacterium]|nr:GNAT family N-acetyltransferase [Lachnospiraceae bacterium]